MRVAEEPGRKVVEEQAEQVKSTVEVSWLVAEVTKHRVVVDVADQTAQPLMLALLNFRLPAGTPHKCVNRAIGPVDVSPFDRFHPTNTAQARYFCQSLLAPWPSNPSRRLPDCSSKRFHFEWQYKRFEIYA